MCPYRFLVEDAVAELERERAVEVVVRPYELRPDPVPTLRPEGDYLPQVRTVPPCPSPCTACLSHGHWSRSSASASSPQDGARTPSPR